MNARTATQLAMASEEWARIEALEDRVTIDDALIGTLRDRIRELTEELNSTVRLLDAANVDNDRLLEVLDRLVNGKEAQTLMAAEYAQWAYQLAQAALLAPASDEECHSAV